MGKNEFTYNIPVRYFDLDTNNHVNNSVYFTYMEEARTKLMLKEFLAFFDTNTQKLIRLPQEMISSLELLV